MHSLPASALERLHSGLAGLGLDPGLAAPLGAYLSLLLQWNRAYNLTAVRDPDEMVTRHLLDSLTIVPHLAGCAKVVDIGTGAGLPGIPLALALPDIRVTLVETVGKKARFLREAVRLLELAPRVRVLEMRGEQVAEPDAHDCLVARALGTLAMLLATGGHLIRPGGRLLAMKGQRPDEEIAALPAGWRLGEVIPLAVPGLAAERHLIVVERVRDPVAA